MEPLISLYLLTASSIFAYPSLRIFLKAFLIALILSNKIFSLQEEKITGKNDFKTLLSLCISSKRVLLIDTIKFSEKILVYEGSTFNIFLTCLDSPNKMQAILVHHLSTLCMGFFNLYVYQTGYKIWWLILAKGNTKRSYHVGKRQRDSGTTLKTSAHKV